MDLKKRIMPLTAALLLAMGGVLPQAHAVDGRDHPYLSRMSGLQTHAVKVKDFDEYVFPLERQVWGKKKMKKMRVEGKVTRMTYTAPENISSFQIARYYENELKNAGYAVQFSARGSAISDERPYDWYDRYYPEHPLLYGQYLDDPNNRQYYFNAKLPRPEGDIYVTFYTIPLSDVKTLAQIDVIETVSDSPAFTPAAGTNVPSDLSLVIAELRRNGHYPVYDIDFEAGKATIIKGSEKALKMIADVINANPGLSVYIVGNTDSSGDFARAKELSQARADMVARVLTFTYKVDASRVQPEGVGPLWPVVANQPGFAGKNNRIELVVK